MKSYYKILAVVLVAFVLYFTLKYAHKKYKKAKAQENLN